MVALLSILTLAMLVGIGIYMGWRQRRIAQTLAYEKVREGLYFHPGHVWASFQPTGIAKVGIDRFLRGILGRVEEVILPSAGRYVKQGQVVMTSFPRWTASCARRIHTPRKETKSPTRTTISSSSARPGCRRTLPG